MGEAAAQLAIRPATAEDKARIDAIFRRCFPWFERILFSDSGHTLVAEEPEAGVVGAAVLRYFDVGGRRVGVVEWIFVDPEAGTSGVGSRLRDAGQEWFDEHGCDEQVARIEPLNTASEALHRGAGFVPLSFRQQLRRWGKSLPLVWLKTHSGFDPGLRLWGKPGVEEQRNVAGRWMGTVVANAALLAVVAWRAPRSLEAGVPLLAWTLGIALVLLGLREGVIRAVASRRGLTLDHVPWATGTGLAAVLALLAGVWFPLTGSSVPREKRWRYDRSSRDLGPSYFVAGLAVAAVALALVSASSAPAWFPLQDVRRAAVMLALLDLTLPTSPMLGSTARVVYDWSRPAWAVLAAGGLAPLALTLFA